MHVKAKLILAGAATAAVAASVHAQGQAPGGRGQLSNKAEQQLDLKQIPPPQEKPPVELPIFRQDPTLVSTPLEAAPEVLRLWSPETVASVKLTGQILKSVAALDSPEFKVREEASAALSVKQVTPEEIFAVLVRGGLSDEQRERLLTIAQAKVLGLPRGALGLRMQPSGDAMHPGVEVVMLLPGLPAERVLKLGDRIEMIDGRAIGTSNDLVEIVQTKLPGESVRISLARPQRDERGKPRIGPDGKGVEEQLVFDVPLTSATDLEKFEDRLPPTTRSVIIERRLLALKEAEERFAPEAVVVRLEQSPAKEIRKPAPVGQPQQRPD